MLTQSKPKLIQTRLQYQYDDPEKGMVRFDRILSLRHESDRSIIIKTLTWAMDHGIPVVFTPTS